MEKKELSLPNLCNGEIVEMFDHEMERVYANIQDVNTDPGQMREITIKVKFKTIDNDRSNVMVVAEVKPPKLAGFTGSSDVVVVGKSNETGKAIAVSISAKQDNLFGDDEPSVRAAK